MFLPHTRRLFRCCIAESPFASSHKFHIEDVASFPKYPRLFFNKLSTTCHLHRFCRNCVSNKTYKAFLFTILHRSTVMTNNLQLMSSFPKENFWKAPLYSPSDAAFFLQYCFSLHLSFHHLLVGDILSIRYIEPNLYQIKHKKCFYRVSYELEVQRAEIKDRAK